MIKKRLYTFYKDEDVSQLLTDELKIDGVINRWYPQDCNHQLSASPKFGMMQSLWFLEMASSSDEYAKMSLEPVYVIISDINKPKHVKI